MGRTLALDAVEAGVLTALNVAAIRTLCPGGVYRGVPLAQAYPYLSIGPSRETPWNTAGTNYGSEVTVQVKCLTSGADPNGASRAATILSAALDLLELRGDLTVSGWTVCDVWWRDTSMEAVVHDDGGTGYLGSMTFTVQVRQ